MRTCLTIAAVLCLAFTSTSPKTSAPDSFRPFTHAHAIADGWRVHYDVATGAPAVVYGPGIPITPDAFLSDHAELLRLGSSDLTKTRHTKGPKLTYVRFEQLWHGVPVVDAAIDLRIRDGKIFLVRANIHPDLEVSVKPDVTRAAAVKRAHEALREAGYGTTQYGPPPTLAVFPVRRGAHKPLYPLVWKTLTRTTHPAGLVVAYIDAHTGAVVHHENTFRYQTATDLTVEAEYEPRLVGDALITDTLPFFGTGNAAGVQTHTVTGTLNVNLDFSGPFTDIEHQTQADATAQVTLAEGVNQTFTWNDTNASLAERNSFKAVHVVRERMLQMAPAEPWLQTQVTVNVAIDSECNAFWDGTSANFFRESTTCNDTGRIADVVYHELGHGLHQELSQGALDGAAGEGIGDYLAATITGDPVIAPTFYKTGAGIRDLEPDRVYPTDLSGEVHEDGLIWGGALWDLRTAMIALYGPALGVQTTDTIFADSTRGGPTLADGYWEVLAADDDDADLTNGTPNVCTINTAFGLHGLGPGPGAGIAFGHTTIGAQPEDTAVAIRASVFAQFPQCGTFDPGTATLYWRNGETGPFQSVPLTLTGGSEFAGEIPGVPPGTKVNYYLEAGTGAETRTEPPAAPGKLFEYYVGPLLTVFFDDFEDEESVPPVWTHAATRSPQDPDAQALADDWELGMPLGLADDPMVAFSGAQVWGNDLGTYAGVPSDGNYRPNITNHLLSPEIDCRGFRGTRLQFRRWLNAEDGIYDQARIRINDQPVWVNEPGTGGAHHRDSNWYFYDIDISRVADKKKIRIQFEIDTDPGLQMGGWNLDDVAVVATHTGPIPKEGCKCVLVNPEKSRGPGVSMVCLVLMVTMLSVFRRRRSR